MLQSFTRYAGIAQTSIGILGATGFSPALGAGTGGSVFNILSGAALGYLGFNALPAENGRPRPRSGERHRGRSRNDRVNRIAGIPLNAGTVASIVNLAIGAWGILAGMTSKKAAHA